MTAADLIDKIDGLLQGQPCWCTWDSSWLPLTHEEVGLANEYPAHQPSQSWNLPEPELGYCSWYGSEDSASTEDEDLDEDQPPCWICGWSPSEEPDHDQWVTDDTLSPPHAYEPGARETGDSIISRMNVYELDGVVRCPCTSPRDDPDQPVWALYRCYLRTQYDDEGFLDVIKDGLTVRQAIALSHDLGYGCPVGV